MPDPVSQYGRIILATDVRNAVATTIKTWLPSYLAEVARQTHRPTVPPTFRSFRSSAKNFEAWPSDQLPCCVIRTPGIDSSSIERHSNLFSVVWPIGVGVLVKAKNQNAVIALGELYSGALRAIFVQHGALGGFAEETDWIDEDYDELGFDESRFIVGASVNIRVRVASVLDSTAGLAEPPTDPIAAPGDPSLVVSTGVHIAATPPFSSQEIDI